MLALDSRDIELSIDRAHAEHAQAEAQLRLVQAGSRPEDIRQAQSQVETARAEVSAPRVELDAAEQDLERFDTLLKNNSGSRKQRDDAATRRDVAKTRVRRSDGARAQQRDECPRNCAPAPAAKKSMPPAPASRRSTRRSPSLREELTDATLHSPVGRLVTEKLVEVGEVHRAADAGVVVVDLDHAWADVFVPEPTVPQIKIGQPATVFTDAGGARPRRHDHLHLTEGGVHAAQRADRGGAIEAGLPRPHHRRQQGRRAQAGHAGRSGNPARREVHDAAIVFRDVVKRYGTATRRRRRVVQRAAAARCSG